MKSVFANWLQPRNPSSLWIELELRNGVFQTTPQGSQDAERMREAERGSRHKHLVPSLGGNQDDLSLLVLVFSCWISYF